MQSRRILKFVGVPQWARFQLPAHFPDNAFNLVGPRAKILHSLLQFPPVVDIFQSEIDVPAHYEDLAVQVVKKLTEAVVWIIHQYYPEYSPRSIPRKRPK